MTSADGVVARFLWYSMPLPRQPLRMQSCAVFVPVPNYGKGALGQDTAWYGFWKVPAAPVEGGQRGYSPFFFCLEANILASMGPIVAGR